MTTKLPEVQDMITRDEFGNLQEKVTKLEVDVNVHKAETKGQISRLSDKITEVVADLDAVKEQLGVLSSRIYGLGVIMLISTLVPDQTKQLLLHFIGVL